MEILFNLWRGLFLLAAYEYVRGVLVPLLTDRVFGITPQIRLNLAKAVGIYFWVSLIAAFWLSAIQKAQFAPHVITQSINGRVINQFTTTNPAYVTFTENMALETNGLGLKRVAVTNYYWRQWSIFKAK